MAILNCYDRQETGGKLPLLIEHDSILAPIIHASFIGLVRYNSERAFHASSEMSEEQFQSSIERIKELIGAFDGADTPPFIPTQLRFLRLIPQLQHAALMVREHAHHDSIQHVLDILNNVYEKLTVLPSLTQANDGQLLLKACESTRGVCLKLRETGFPGSALSIAERVQMLVERTAILNPSPESAALSDTVKSEVYSLGNEMTEFAKCAKDFDRSSLANIRKEFKLWKPHPEGNLKLWRETLLKRYPIVSHQ
jgi:hypothetical protein